MRKVLLTLVLFLFATPAVAGVLGSISGGVFVNTGSGFTKVAATTELKPGDKVRIADDGAARLTYDADCAVALEPNQVVVVRTASQVCGAVQADAYVIGGVVVAGGAGIAIAVSDDDSPASP